jgi:hypothetical protein
LTASEKLIALAEERANSPENLRELMVLVLDRATSAKMSEINYEIGHDAGWNAGRYIRYSHLRDSELESLTKDKSNADQRVRIEEYRDGKPSDYALLLQEYVGLKLQLHRLRKSMYYPYDAYCEREGDFAPILERCKELREKIRERRTKFSMAVWGVYEPEPAPRPDDKPLLYAFNDYTCSHMDSVIPGEDISCPLNGEYWFRGLPYCRQHLGEAKREVKEERRWKQMQARARHRVRNATGDWSIEQEKPVEPCTYRMWGDVVCDRKYPHAHFGGKVERL